MAPPGEATIVYPPELRAELPDDYAISIEPPRQLLPGEPAYRERCLDYLGRLRRLAEQRLAVTLRLLREQAWDLLSVVFYEPDRIQHFFWTGQFEPLYKKWFPDATVPAPGRFISPL